MSTSSISLVLIGLNVERFLPDCLASIRNVRWPCADLEKIYVDSGSTDRSCQIVAAEPGWRVLNLNDPKPSVAKGRNMGIAHAQGRYVQLLDADMVIDPDWLPLAVGLMEKDPRLAVVFGRTIERYPRRNVYHAMRHALWSMHPVGVCNRMPGASLIRTQAVRECALHRQNVRGFEDVELAQRLGAAGYALQGLPEVMCRHDSDMSRFGQYWRSNVRGGQGNYDILRYSQGVSRWYFLRELRRSMLWVGIVATSMVTAILGQFVVAMVLLAIFAAGVAREVNRGWRHGGTLVNGAAWSCHWVLSKIPYCVGFVGAWLSDRRGGRSQQAWR